MPNNQYMIAKVGVDKAETGLSKVVWDPVSSGLCGRSRGKLPTNLEGFHAASSAVRSAASSASGEFLQHQHVLESYSNTF